MNSGFRGRPTLRISITALFTALVAAATMMFSLYIPATRGYFNVGETMVYLTALLFGPLIGAVAGGVGSMLADVYLGYSHYAPGTLIIKGAEGGIVGYVGLKLYNTISAKNWRALSLGLGAVAAILIGSIGAYYYVGGSELSIGLPRIASTVVLVEVPLTLWIVLAFLMFAVISYLGFTSNARFTLLVVGVLLGGAVMVTGYFAYEAIVLSAGWGALAEVPFNIAQVAVGLLVSVPLARAVWRRIPWVRPEYK